MFFIIDSHSFSSKTFVFGGIDFPVPPSGAATDFILYEYIA